MAIIIKYNKITIDHDIYTKVLSDGTVSYIKFSTDDVLNTNNNETAFTKLTNVFEENFEMKVKGGSVIKYLNLRIFQSPLGFSVNQPDHIMELVNERFPTGKLINLDTAFRTDSTHEK